MIETAHQPQKTVGQWLREDVVKTYGLAMADSSINEPIDVVFDKLMSEFADE